MAFPSRYTCNDLKLAAISSFLQTRQLESMVRLAEARARVELRGEVTREDAEVPWWWWAADDT